jgi:methyltransferase (TIGR00027 family)
MKKTQTSTTARGIAAMRAIETEKGPGSAICTDPFARRFTTLPFYLLSKLFSGYGERRAPGAQGFIICRCRCFDDYLRDCLGNGVRQVVILGAGLDSRAYRRDPGTDVVRFFEVDQPATQAAKIRRVKAVMGGIPANVTHVPIDFNEETLDALRRHGFDPARRTLFLWEGVTYYLDPGAVDATLAWIRSNACAGSTVIFDYISSSAIAGGIQRGEVKRMQRYSRFTGERLVFGIGAGEVGAFMVARGFSDIVEIDAEALKRRYCTGPNSGRAVAEAYAIVHARV